MARLNSARLARDITSTGNRSPEPRLYESITEPGMVKLTPIENSEALKLGVLDYAKTIVALDRTYGFSQRGMQAEISKHLRMVDVTSYPEAKEAMVIGYVKALLRYEETKPSEVQELAKAARKR